MKKRIFSLFLVFVLVCTMLSSCLFVPLVSQTGDEYLTKEEVEALINGAILDGSKVEAGDTNNIYIENPVNTNTAAAAKGLLSAVSVYCNFKIYSSGYERSETSAGAGVIYKLDKNSGDAYIITNYHVVYNSKASTKNKVSDDIYVYLYGQETVGYTEPNYAIKATYIGGTMNYDLAVLKVSGSATLAKSAAVEATVSNSDLVQVLDTAIAIGNPEGAGISATLGSVNVDSEYITMTGADNVSEVSMRVMRVDTAVNSGNSGGGLYNDKGELIGIVNAKMAASSVDNIGYAIPSNVVKAIADNIIYYCSDGERESVYRCLLGITVRISDMYTEIDSDSLKIYKRERVAVEEVNSAGLAKGKLLKGDVIEAITIDGVRYEVNRMYNVVDSMLNARVGSTVVLSVDRGGAKETVTITVTEATLTQEK